MKSRIGLSAILLAAFVLGVVSVHPIARAVEMLGVVTCATTVPCTGGTNTAKGPGVQGTSSGSNGVLAQTTFTSTNATHYRSGVLGQDLSTKGNFDVGVTGTSTRGTGVLGTSSSDIGVNGLSSTNTGVWGQDNGGTKNPTGVVGIDASKSTSGAGVAGQSAVGSGVVGTTTGSSNSTQSFLGLAPNGGFVFIGAGSGNNVVAALDNAGNLTIDGQIYTGGQCNSGCTRRAEESYGESAATPTIEDSGEAQLTMGAAYVRIDPNFVNAVDARQGYFVLITPETDTRGLYVAQRTPAGFYVRENLGGRSSGQFAYRIVAHPFGVRAARLPYVDRRTVVPQTRIAQ